MAPEPDETMSPTPPGRDAGPACEPLGQRIARLRCLLGWTQQELADRIAISRVAVSHLESAISDPSERTVTLLAGVFHLEPLDLVAGTSYPAPKSERLPLVTARYTEVEHQVAMLRRDLTWLERLSATPEHARLAERTREEWRLRLAELMGATLDPHERRLLAEARAALAVESGRVRHSARAP